MTERVELDIEYENNFIENQNYEDADDFDEQSVSSLNRGDKYPLSRINNYSPYTNDNKLQIFSFGGYSSSNIQILYQ